MGGLLRAWALLASLALAGCGGKTSDGGVRPIVPEAICHGPLEACVRAGAAWQPLSMRATLEKQVPRQGEALTAPVTLRAPLPASSGAMVRVQGGNNTKRVGVLLDTGLAAATERRPLTPLWIDVPVGARSLVVEIARPPAADFWPFVAHVGTQGALAADTSWRILGPTAVACWALVIALLQAFAAFERRNRKGALLVAGTAATFAVRVFVMQRSWTDWWTPGSMRVSHALEYASLPVAVALVAAFYEWAAGATSDAKPSRAYNGVAVVLAAACFFVRMGSALDIAFLRVLQLFVLVGAVRIAYFVRLALARARGSERPLIAIGVVALVVSGIADIVVSQTTNDFFLGVGYVASGFIVETICQALIVAQRSSAAHDRVDELAGELEAKNASLERTNQVLETELAERRRLQGELESATQQLTQAENMATLGMLMAGIAHDIRNPLNYVQNAVTRLEEAVPELSSDDADARKAGVEAVVMSTGWVKQGAATMDAISLAMRNQSRGGGADFEVVGLRDVASEALLLCASRTRLCAIDVQVTERSVYADATGIGQVVMNLVSNAADALVEARAKDRGAPMDILVRGTVTDYDATLEVHDSGPGIPEALRAKILEPFFSTKPRGQGTGLGLAIVQRVVRQHAGTLEVGRSAELGGARFVFRWSLR
jgi:signal transduction histidine kinase